mmetsp:Transcript_81273/g.131726  ORF Transcript_81273/g.131726 Transcript_81273/m.131726 type:complete len:266 (+) Transcript_81273:2350-3147(+)
MDRESPEQRLYVLVVELRGTHHREVHYAPCHVVRNKGVTVAIASHPRTQCDELAVNRQRRLTNAVQRVFNGDIMLGDSIPQSLLNDRETIARFVLRGGFGAAHVVGAPDGQQVVLDVIEGILLLERRVKVASAIQGIERRINARVFFEDTAAHRLGRMRCKHQLQILLRERLVNLLGCEATLDKMLEAISCLVVLPVREEQHLNLAPFVHAPTAEPMVALSQVDLPQQHCQHARYVLHLGHRALFHCSNNLAQDGRAVSRCILLR